MRWLTRDWCNHSHFLLIVRIDRFGEAEIEPKLTIEDKLRTH